MKKETIYTIGKTYYYQSPVEKIIGECRQVIFLGYDKKNDSYLFKSPINTLSIHGFFHSEIFTQPQGKVNPIN